MRCYDRLHEEYGLYIACLAGWACILLDENFGTAAKYPIYYIDTASQIFGFSENEKSIFYPFHEPDEVIDILSESPS